MRLAPPPDPASHRRRRFRAAATFACAITCGPALADPDLAVRLSPGPAPGELAFELVNEGDAPVSVLRTGTPLDPVLSEDAFDVRRTVKGWPGVERPVYVGRLYKRAAPGPGDFVELAPGGTLANVVDVERHYEVANAGDYAVRFAGSFQVVGSIAAPSARDRDGPVTVVPDGDGTEIALQPGNVRPRARPPAFSGCDAAQQTEIVDATLAAEGIATEALAALTDLSEPLRPAAPRYARWFGEYSPSRYAAVTDAFEAIAGALSGETLGLDCTCDEAGVYAYVYANEPYDVYLCPVFFQAPTLGTDSRAGTLVHELSHFEILAGTDDYRYGQYAAATLAGTDPDLSVDNADNLEYFAENTPALPMTGDGGPVAPVTDAPVPAPPTEPAPFVELALDAPVRGSLAEGERAPFAVEGADTISLTSLSGDADLYVFDDPDLRGDPVCTADAYSEQSTLDLCELPSGDVWYAVVGGFTATDYEIVATAVDLGGTAPGTGPEPATEMDSSPEPVPMAEPAPTDAPGPTVPDPIAEPTPEPASEPVSEPAPEPTPAPVPEPTSTTAPAPAPAPQNGSDPDRTPAPDPGVPSTPDDAVPADDGVIVTSASAGSPAGSSSGESGGGAIGRAWLGLLGGAALARSGRRRTRRAGRA